MKPECDPDALPPYQRRGVLAGLLLVVVGCGVFAEAWSLAGASATSIGPGTVPRMLGLLIALTGIAVLWASRADVRDGIEPWRTRSTLFILGAVLCFAGTIRPLGLLVAVPLTFVIASLGSPQTRTLEMLLSAVILTACSIVLFVYALRLAIPVAPFLN